MVEGFFPYQQYFGGKSWPSLYYLYVPSKNPEVLLRVRDEIDRLSAEYEVIMVEGFFLSIDNRTKIYLQLENLV